MRRKDVHLTVDSEILQAVGTLAEYEGLSTSKFLERMVASEIRLRAKAYAASKDIVKLKPKTADAVNLLSENLGVSREEVVEQALGIALGLLVMKVSDSQEKIAEPKIEKKTVRCND